MRVPVPVLFFHLILHSYDYNMHVERLLPASLRLVTLLSLEQCAQFDIFHMQYAQIVNKTQFQKKSVWQ